MIKRLVMNRLTAEGTTERSIPFKEGLNIVLADRSQKSGKKGSRNGLGKSTLIEIIDFCLGSEPDRDNTLPAKLLKEWTFTLELEIRGVLFSASRSCLTPNEVYVTGNIEGEPPLYSPQSVLGETRILYSADNWRTYLGWAMFGLPPKPDPNDELSIHAPRYETLISHFIRKVFDNPLTTQHREWRASTEMAVTYLLGLDHVFLEKAKHLRKVKKEIDSKRSAAEQQSRKWVGEIRLLEAKCAEIENALTARQAQLDEFRAKQEVIEISESLSQLTRDYRKISAERVINKRKLDAAVDARQMHFRPFDDVKKIYEDAGAIFAQDTIVHMDKVKIFHDTLQKNYSQIIEEEIAVLEKALDEADKKLDELDEKRAQKMQAQKAQDAFSQFASLNDSLAEAREELAVKRDCLARYNEAIAATEAYETERKAVVDEAKTKHEDLSEVWKGEEAFFCGFIHRLYGEYKFGDVGLGIKVDSVDPIGIRYNPFFPSDRSLGRKKLKTLGFDLTLLDHQRTNPLGIDFMVHDSVLFESSDSRQFAEALLFIDEFCAKTKSQYITVLNSDDANSKDFKDGIELDTLRKKYVVYTLHDAGPEGTLLGVPF